MLYPGALARSGTYPFTLVLSTLCKYSMTKSNNYMIKCLSVVISFAFVNRVSVSFIHVNKTDCVVYIKSKI